MGISIAVIEVLSFVFWLFDQSMSAKRIVEVATIVLNHPNEPTTDVEESKSKHGWLRTYVSKWTGQHASAPASTITLVEYIITFFGTFAGVILLAAIHYRLLTQYVYACFLYSTN